MTEQSQIKAGRIAKLIAELWEAERWNPKRDLSDHPILSPVAIRRSARYEELKRKMGFTEARLTADEEAIQQIINIRHEQSYLSAEIDRLNSIIDEDAQNNVSKQPE